MRTKLAAYLSRKDESHRAFADRAGIPHLHPMISQWASGKRFPGLEAALAIETATEGEVPARYWLKLSKSVRGSRRHHPHSITDPES